MNDKKIIGRILKEERLKKDITLETLGEQIGVSKATISRYENEGISDLEKIELICNILQININDVLINNPVIIDENQIKGMKYNSLKFDIINNNETFDIACNKIKNDMKTKKNVFIFSNNNKLLNNTFKIFKDNDYDIKILDFKNLNADFYNPIVYLKNDLDVMEFVTHVIKEIFQKDDDLNLIIQSLIFYLIKYRPMEERNFTSVMKLLRAAESDPVMPRVKTPLDRIFDEVAKRDPNSIALKQYMGTALYGRDINKVLFDAVNVFSIFNENSVANFTEKDNVKLDNFDKKKVIFVICPNSKIMIPLYKIFCYQLMNILSKDFHDEFNIEINNDIKEYILENQNVFHLEKQNVFLTEVKLSYEESLRRIGKEKEKNKEI